MPKTTRGRVQIVYSSSTEDSEFDLKLFFLKIKKKSPMPYHPLPKSIPSAAVNFPKWFTRTFK